MNTTTQCLRLAPGETCDCPTCGMPLVNQQQVHVALDMGVEDVPEGWASDLLLHHTDALFCSKVCLEQYHAKDEWQMYWEETGWAQEMADRESRGAFSHRCEQMA